MNETAGTKKLHRGELKVVCDKNVFTDPWRVFLWVEIGLIHMDESMNFRVLEL